MGSFRPNRLKKACGMIDADWPTKTAPIITSFDKHTAAGHLGRPLTFVDLLERQLMGRGSPMLRNQLVRMI